MQRRGSRDRCGIRAEREVSKDDPLDGSEREEYCGVEREPDLHTLWVDNVNKQLNQLRRSIDFVSMRVRKRERERVWGESGGCERKREEKCGEVVHHLGMRRQKCPSKQAISYCAARSSV